MTKKEIRKKTNKKEISEKKAINTNYIRNAEKWKRKIKKLNKRANKNWQNKPEWNK